MTLGTKLNSALTWLADRTLIGLLTLLAALPIVTAAAAMTAGAKASAESSLRAGLLMFWRTYWRFMVRSIIPSVIAVVLAASAFTSFIMIGPTVPAALRAGFYAAGMISGATSVLTISYTAVCHHMGVAVTPRNIGTLVLLTPGAALRFQLLAALTLVAASTVGVLALPIVGVAVAAVSRVQARYLRKQLSRPDGARRS
jgi:hypothetical protein